jgi:hypothetical protein
MGAPLSSNPVLRDGFIYWYSTWRPRNAELFWQFAIQIEIQRRAAIGITVYTDVGMADMRLIFAEGTTLPVSYWRLVKDEKELSSFDHGQKYRRPAALDAMAELQKEWRDKAVTGAQLDKETGDLILKIH